MEYRSESNAEAPDRIQPATGICSQCGGPVYVPGVCPWCAQSRMLPMRELSLCYKEAAKPLRARLHQLRHQLGHTHDEEQIWHIKRQIAELTPILTQMNELAQLTEHYYDRGYWRSEKYTL